MNRYSLAPSSHHHRHSSLSANTQTTTALTNRINEKKAELENLVALRALSANLAQQMQQLEEKLATLTDGTAAVAQVLANWHTVLRAIAMASTKLPKPKAAGNDDKEQDREEEEEEEEDPFTDKKKGAEDEEFGGFPKSEEGQSMPHTLVRVPVQTQQAE